MQKQMALTLLFFLGASAARAADCDTAEQMKRAIIGFAVEHYGMSAFGMSVFGGFAEPVEDRSFRVTFESNRYIWTGEIEVRGDCAITNSTGAALDDARLRREAIGCRER